MHDSTDSPGRLARNAAIVFAVALVAYVITLPRTITLEDAGLFQMVCHLGGISHPPGYPLFTLACQAFVGLPFFGDSVFAGNLLSAIFAALASAVFYVICSLLTASRIAFIGALGYAFSATFWSQAIIIEVYSLAAFTYLTCFALCLGYVRYGGVRWLYGLAFAYGLALSNHWPLVGLSTPALIAVLWPRYADILAELKRPIFLLASLALLLGGLTPYLSLLQADPRIAMYGGVDGLDEFVYYVSRGPYSDNEAAAGLADKALFMGWFAMESARQLGWLALPVILAGAVRSFLVWPRSLAWSVLLLFVGTTLLLAALLGHDYEFFNRAIYRPYPVIACAALALWFTLGAEALLRLLDRFDIGGMTRVATAAILVISVFLSNFSGNNRNSNMVDIFMRATLESLPRDAIVFARGDYELFTAGYLHRVEGVRPDTTLYSWNGLVLENRLASPYAPQAEQRAARERFIRGAQRPVVALGEYLPDSVNLGTWHQYVPGAGGRAVPNPGAVRLLDYLLDINRQNLISDPHETQFTYRYLVTLGRWYVKLTYGTEPDEAQRERLARLAATFPGKMVMLEQQLSRASRQHLLDLARGAERQIPYFVNNQALGVLYEYFGRIMLMDPADVDRAIADFERSLREYPGPDNKSICPLTRAYRQAGDETAADALRQRFPDVPCADG